MLQPRLNNCVDCTSIPSLLEDIDCKLTEMAKSQYNNIVFALNKRVNTGAINDLLNYKRILTYRYCNPNYAVPFTIEQIVSKIKILIYK
jgi:hypothetical protein